jgi:hypothetical protein
MGLREIESTLPPGFRFYPSDEELVCHYLYRKVANERSVQGTLVEVDLHAREPWELPGDSFSSSPSPMHDAILSCCSYLSLSLSLAYGCLLMRCSFIRCTITRVSH